MLSLQIERVLRSKRIEKLVLATSSDASDDRIVEMCKSLDVAVFRGDLHDVLDRFYQAAKMYRPEYVVRLTGDCPLTDPVLIDRVIEMCLDSGADYVSNSVVPSFPDGLDVEVFRFEALETAWKEASALVEREHVTPFIYRHPDRFSVQYLRSHVDLSALRWTVDEQADFDLVRAIYESLYSSKPEFGMEDVLALLERVPDLGKGNSHIQRNAGMAKSSRSGQSDIEKGSL